MMKKRKTKKKKTLINKIKKWLHTKDGKQQQEINKQLVVIIISIFITVITVIGVTYSAFVWSDNSEKNQNIVAGNVLLSISSTSGELGSGLDYPVPESSESSLEPYTFTIKNDGSLSASYKLRIVSNNSTENTLDTEYIYMSLDGGKTINRTSLKNFENYPIDQGALEPNETKTYNLRLWIVGDAPNSVIGGTWNGKIVLESSQTTPGEPNEPILANGMIPVIYDETNDVWKVANTSSEWYNYDKQMWANAVTTSVASYRTASPGTEIPMDAINSMWVWIPRFKYKITTGFGKGLTSPPQIDVVFEEGTNTTGVAETTYRAGLTVGGTNTNYYTHPIFRNGTTVYNTSAYDIGGWDRELTGVWVGKFETGNSADNPLIKPDILALVSQNASTQYTTSLKFAGGTMDTLTGEVIFSGNSTYGLVSGTDTHMMKNTEWGAVAILSQSQYGKMGNTDYEAINKEVYKNNSSSKYTGRSSGVPPTSGSTAYGTYSYNDKSCSASQCTGDKTINAGRGASTTGTIYGVYDMSGGIYDRLMGNWNKYTGKDSSNNSGFNGSYGDGSGENTSGISFPERKYYDLYSGESSTSTTKAKTILGYATWETSGWYNDANSFVYETYPWPHRGGLNSGTAYSGVFATANDNNGHASSITGFRTVLIP